MSQVSLYKMNRAEDGTFTKGELISELIKDNVITANEEDLTYLHDWHEVVYDGFTEDCWIGLEAQAVRIDDFVNYYVESKVYEVSVEVKDVDGNAVPGAVVTLACGDNVVETVADADGLHKASFKAKEVESQTWTATATAPYYLDAAQEFVIDSDKTLTLTLDHLMYEVAVSVKDAEGKAVVDAQVTLSREDRSLTAQGDESGVYAAAFKAADVDGQTWKVTATAPYYIEQSADLTLDADKELDMTLAPQMYEVAVSVKDAEGEPVEAEVTLACGERSVTLDADAQGKCSAEFKAKEVDGLTWTATAKAHGYEEASEQFTFEGNGAAVSLTLEAVMRTYTARVADTEGNVLAHATLSVKDGDGTGIDLTADGQGTFSFTMPLLAAEGREYTATAAAEGYDPTDDHVFSLDAGDEEHLFVLKKTVGLQGVMDAGRGVRNVGGKLYVSGDVVVSDPAGRVVRVMRQAPEGTPVEGLPAGLYIANGVKVIIR